MNANVQIHRFSTNHSKICIHIQQYTNQSNTQDNYLDIQHRKLTIPAISAQNMETLDKKMSCQDTYISNQ